jgi:hypothetical protein
MLYLLDANVLITANHAYYPLDQVPEFWSWIQHQGERENVKMPLELMEELLVGNAGDPLVEWLKTEDVRRALLLEESVDPALVQRVVSEGYASDLTDQEVEQVGRDPFLVAYGLADRSSRCVVTLEVSKPSKRRQNRKVPDVCNFFSVQWCGPFEVNRALGFRTSWKA